MVFKKISMIMGPKDVDWRDMILWMPNPQEIVID